MGVAIKVPAVGESITEALVSEWFKNEGDLVAEGEPVCSLETDKVTVEVPAPASGTLAVILAKSGQTVAIGDTIGEVAAASMGTAAVLSAPQPAPIPVVPPTSESPRTTPAAKRLMETHQVSPAALVPTGPKGHILKEDVQKALSGANPSVVPDVAPPPVAQSTPHPASPSVTRPLPPVPPIGETESDGRQNERVPMTPLRRRVAQRLVSAQQTAAILTTFNEVDMTAVLLVREKYQDTFVKKYGTKLGFMSFFVKASIDALKAFPSVNAEIDGDDIVYKNYFDISVAVGGGKGLVVPVLRDADRMSFAGIELKLAELADKAKNNKLSLEELQGGTFTISNGGIYGSLLSTPILNPPQSGILGMHKIEKRPVVVDDQIVIRQMMYLAFSYDHRLIDGREAVSFLVRIKECIEAPERMLFEV